MLTGDQSEQVVTLVEDLENNIIAGILFVIVVLLFFLGVRNAALVGLAIPLSMFLTFLTFSVMGQTLNFIILFSLIIALGMLVDNAVVIIENIYRFKEEGYSNWEAAQKGTSEVGLAVAASTATTVAAFAPMLLWPGTIGKFMGYMPLTLIITLSASLFVALIINPVIAGYFVKTEAEIAEDKAKKDASGARGENPTQRKIALGLVAFTAIIVGIARWQTLIFLAIAIPALVLLYRKALNPAHQRFANVTVPRMTKAYRGFLSWMLQRDYTVARGLLRNTFALGSFTAGFLLLIAGAALNAAAAPAGFLLIVPGGILLLVGVIAMLVHSVETAFLGGKVSMKVGMWFGAVVLVLIALLTIGGKIGFTSVKDLEVIGGMLAIPILLLVAGALGSARGEGRKQTNFGSPYIFLTDNRARLLTATLGTLFGVIGLFAVAPTGVEFFPTTDPNQIMITAEAPIGTTIERSNEVSEEVFSRVNGLMQSDPATAANTENISTSVGVGGDAMFGGGAASAERSSITMNMVDYADRAEESSSTIRRIRESLAGLPGIDLTITQDQGGPPTGAAVNIEVSGKEFEEIQNLADGIKQTLITAQEAGRLPGLVDIRDNLNSGRPEYRIEIDRERAAAFGLSTRAVALGVRGAVNGVEASKWRDGKDEYDITVRLREEDRESLRQIESLTIFDEGQQIPLTAVARIVPAAGLGSVTRLDQERVVTVLGDAAPGANANEVLALVQAELEETTVERARGLQRLVHRRERGAERELQLPHDGAADGPRAHLDHPDRAVQLGQEPDHHHGGGGPDA